ncbi:UNVERIFIED_CONTAM: hypothetical protein RKD50_009200 [Streptomyces canus]
MVAVRRGRWAPVCRRPPADRYGGHDEQLRTAERVHDVGTERHPRVPLLPCAQGVVKLQYLLILPGSMVSSVTVSVRGDTESAGKAGRRGQPARSPTRRKRGRTDAVDADAAARAVLSGRAAVTPKTGEDRAADVRVLRPAKESAVKARTQAENQRKAVLLGIDPELRESLSELSNSPLIARCADLPDTGSAAVFTLRLPARRVQQLTDEVKELTRRVNRGVPRPSSMAPGHRRRRARQCRCPADRR